MNALVSALPIAGNELSVTVNIPSVMESDVRRGLPGARRECHGRI